MGLCSRLNWSTGDTVEVRLVEQSGTAATGKPTISGTARVGQTLTADTSGIADADGLASVSYSYQWIRVQNLLETEISGATASTYTPVADDVGKTIRVKVTFSDDAGNPENSISDAYPSGGTVEDIATGNATGQPVITGAAQVGKTLTAGLGNIADTDGLPGTFPDDYTLQWVRVDADGVSNEADLSGETSGTYTPVAADVGKKIKVAVSFTDDGSTAEGPLTSAAYPSNAPVAAAAGACPAVNDWCGKVTVALEGFSFGYEFDKFGLLDDNMIEYGGKEIEVWTVHVIPQLPRGLTYIYFGSIPRVPRGTVITLGELTYTTDVVSDDGSVGDRWDFPEDGFPPGLDWSVGQEVRVSLVLGSFPAEGAVAISGTAQVGSTLTADPSGITDTDGLTTPTYTYQWLRVDADGVSNETTIGANAATYTLVAADVGKKIKVQVSFTDDRGHIETVTSDATVVAAPPGVTVSKSTLTVTEQSTTGDSYTVVLDSEPTANVVVTVAGHSGTDVTPVPTTLTFTDSDWATAKTVTVTAADDADTVDDEVSLTHSAMSTDTDYSGITIAGVTVTVDDNDDANTPATGQPVITGAAQVGKTLTAGLGNIADTDGLPGTFPDDYTLQWVRVDADGVSNEADLSGETSGTYTPVAADVGKKIKVAVSFTDDGSTAEGPLTSAAYPSNAPVAAAAGACPPDNDWCTTLTVGFSEDGIFKYYGFSTAITDDGLADTTIDDGDGTTWTVSTMVIADAIINDQVHINLDAFLARGSVFDLGGTTFTTDETSESTVTTGNYSWLLPAGFAWVHGQDVTVSVKLPANAPATGVPEISGSPQVGKTLSAGTTGIMDLDGLTSVSYTYQWIRVDVDGTSNPVDVGTDDDEYTLVAADEGKRIKVQVTFTDDDSNAEELTSAAYLTPSHHSYPDRGIMPAQTACPASNTWCATMNVGFQLPGTDNTEFGFSASPGYGALDDTSFDYDGSTFTVENVGIRNPDGMSGYHVRLGLDAFVPRGAVFDLNGYTFTADAAAEQTSTGRYRWALPAGFRIAEGVDYRVSLQLTENTPAAGAPTISGTAQVGETLTAGIGDIADADGLPATFPDDYTFQWLRVDADGMSNETPIGADAVTYTPVAADVGKKIKVRVSFTDDGGTGEALTSIAYPSSGTITAGTLPELSFAGSNITVSETAGTATLTVELDPASTGTVTVDYATSDQTAQAGVDYTAASGTLTFAASETSKTITVPILNDTDYDPSQRFRVTLNNASGATLPTSAWAFVNITNDDAVPTASIANVTVGEGAGTMTLTLALDRLSNRDISYSAVTAGVSGTATVADDYVSFLQGGSKDFTVPAGNLSQTFDITLVDDSVDEPDETIVIVWTKFPSHDATPASITVTGTITDNDTAGNNPPVFDDDEDTSRAFSETLGDAAVITASNIGTAVGAMDADNDTLTYSLVEGTDAAKFGIDTSTGQLQTMAGEKYDYETKSSYAVRIRVVDGNGGADTIDVTVNVNNNSRDAAGAGCADGNADIGGPDEPGRELDGAEQQRPADDYRLRPAIPRGDGGGWNDGPQDISGTSASITGLAEDTYYQVQVRALNADGDGDWSPSGSATTGAPPRQRCVSGHRPTRPLRAWSGRW